MSDFEVTYMNTDELDRLGYQSKIQIKKDGDEHLATNCSIVTPDSWEKIIEDATALGAEMGRRTTQVGDLVERCKRLAEGRKRGDA